MTVGKPTIQNQYLGVFYMIFSVLSWSILDGLSKKLTHNYPVCEIAFFRDGFTALFLLVTGLKQGGIKSFRIYSPSIHIWRSVLFVINAVGFIYAISKISLSDAYTLGFSSPLFMIIFSKITLSEPINKHRWGCLIIGFLGIVVALRPGKEIFEMAGVIALLTGMSYAISTVLINKIDSRESSVTVAFYPNLASAVLTFLYLPSVWLTPSINDTFLFLLSGGLAAIAQYSMVRAVRLAPLSLVAPLEYSALIWVVLIDYLDRKSVV